MSVGVEPWIGSLFRKPGGIPMKRLDGHKRPTIHGVVADESSLLQIQVLCTPTSTLSYYYS